MKLSVDEKLKVEPIFDDDDWLVIMLHDGDQLIFTLTRNYLAVAMSGQRWGCIPCQGVTELVDAELMCSRLEDEVVSLTVDQWEVILGSASVQHYQREELDESEVRF